MNIDKGTADVTQKTYNNYIESAICVIDNIKEIDFNINRSE